MLKDFSKDCPRCHGDDKDEENPYSLCDDCAIDFIVESAQNSIPYDERNYDDRPNVKREFHREKKIKRLRQERLKKLSKIIKHKMTEI